MLNPSNLFLPITPIRPGTLFLVARRYTVRALARAARSAVVQLKLDARLRRLRRADAGHWAGRGTVGGRRCVVEVLPFGVICRLLSEFVDEGVLWDWLVNNILHCRRIRKLTSMTFASL